LLDAGMTAATQTLADRRRFVLDETQWHGSNKGSVSIPTSLNPDPFESKNYLIQAEK
jgi:hypothetical protein